MVHREGPAGPVRRDQPDQGLHRQGDGAPVPRLRVRDPEVLRGGVPDQGPHVQPAAVRERRAPDQGDGRDPAPARVHGRLPVDDGHGDVRHQRRGARRRQPARALARRVLQRARGSGVGPDAVLGQGHPEPRRLARVRDQQQGPAVGQGRSQAQDRGDDPAPRGRLRDQRRDRRAVRCGRRRPRAPVHREHARQGPHQDAQRGADRGLQEAAPGRPAHRGQRPPAGREPVLQLPALRPGPGRPLQVQQEAGRRLRAHGHRAPARGPDDHPRGHRGDRRPPDRVQPGPPPQGRHRPPRQPPHPRQRRADPERVPDRPPAHGARGPRADDDPGDRQGHARTPSSTSARSWRR